MVDLDSRYAYVINRARAVEKEIEQGRRARAEALLSAKPVEPFNKTLQRLEAELAGLRDGEKFYETVKRAYKDNVTGARATAERQYQLNA